MFESTLLFIKIYSLLQPNLAQPGRWAQHYNRANFRTDFVLIMIGYHIDYARILYLTKSNHSQSSLTLFTTPFIKQYIDIFCRHIEVFHILKITCLKVKSLYFQHVKCLSTFYLNITTILIYTYKRYFI